MSWFKRGQDDKGQSQGQVDPNKFKNDTDRKSYQAGYEKQRQEQHKQHQDQK